MERTHAEARAGIPMNADQVRAGIAQMERETKSKAARITIAKAAIRIGNLTEEGRQAYRDYLATLLA